VCFIKNHDKNDVYVTSFTPVFLNSWNSIDVNGYPHTPANLSSGKEPTAPIKQGGELGTRASLATGGEQKNIHLWKNLTQSRLATTLTDLPRPTSCNQ
jgi:hypothetical protein